MSVTGRESLRAFCSYSHRDEEYLNELRISLRGLERQGIIQWWHDREIPPGWEWEEAIDRNLRTAEVILLLVTPDFMGSDYVHENEIVQAVERHERGEARVIPIIVRPADWEWASFGKLQALPKDAKPITTWLNEDEAWLDVVRGVRKAVEDLLLERQMRAAKERYRKAVEKIWVDTRVSSDEAQRLAALASELSLSPDTAADLERDRMGDTVQAILQRQTRMEEERQLRLEKLYAQARRLHQDQKWQAVVEIFGKIHAEDADSPDPEKLLPSAREALELARKEDALRHYREGVGEAWTDSELDNRQVEALRDLADRLKVSPSDSAKAEREVMGETKEAILERLERAAKERERKERLDTLYARARSLHDGQQWQAVVDVFEEMRSEEPAHSDPEGLLQSAREGLKLQQTLAEIYERGLQHMGAQEWPQALECFEEVQQLEPGYREIEKLLIRVERELPKSSTRWEYTDFDLEIGRQSEPRKYPVAARSLGGEAQEVMHFPFDERDLKDKLRDLEVALLRSGGTRRSIGSTEEQAVQEFGRALFDALLVGEVHTRYEVSLREARRQHKGLRLKLHVQPSELSTLPWEFLYDSERDYLGLSSMTPLVRYTDLRQPIGRLTVAPPLRILGMVASPRDLDPLDVEHEKGLMDEATANLRAKGLVELTWLEGDTWRDLQRAMRRGGPWHIFHFVGHGDFDLTTEEGLIAFADERTGRRNLLRSRDLARLLDGHPSLRLVFLNSCEGARGSEGDPFSGTAATLVRRGIPAVVAMQYQITDKAAIEFSRDFYESLADGLPVDAAVTEARVAVSMDSMLEWGTPVLYMRSPDGRLFDISTPALRARPTPETEDQQEVDSLRRYREGVESAWTDGELRANEVQRLRDLADNELRLSAEAAADIEREIMGDTKEAMHERQIEATRNEERNRRLEGLYTQARRLHHDRNWQAVIDLFEQIHEEDRDYPDPAGILASARDALEAPERMKRVAALYERGHRHMDAREWQLALECFEDVQRLNPEYRDTEEQLARVRRELAAPPMVEVPDLLGQRVSEARSSLASKSLKLSVYEEVPSDTIAEGEIIQQSPERGAEMLAGSSVIITVSSGPHEAISTAPTGDQIGAYANRIERVQHVLPASAGSSWALVLRGLAMGIFGLVLLFSNDARRGPFQLYGTLLVIADALFATIDARTGFGRRRLLFIQGRIGGLVGLALLLVWLGYTHIIPNESVQTSVTDFIHQWHIGTRLVGSWAIFVGIIRTVAAVKLRWDTKNLLLMGTSGMLLVVSGILLWAASFEWWWLVGFFMLTSAIVLIAVVVRVRGQEGWGSRAR